jgi:membrane-associated phospholipid phosphatase
VNTELERPRVHPVFVAFYLAGVAALVLRIALLDEWNTARWVVLGLMVATFWRDRVRPTRARLLFGLVFFGLLSMAVAYLPTLWFAISYRLNHASHYLWNANRFMALVPGNDGRFLWSHDSPIARDFFRWVYLNGFDMVVWIPVVRSLVACDALKMARYALSAHLVQFPLIMPFYTAFRVDEVWSVLGHADRCARGWSDEVRHDLGANCFPSMHTSVAFAILLLALREKSATFRVLMVAYATAIIVSTVYMEIHWIIDVFAGVLLGTASVYVTDWLIERGHSRKAVTQPGVRSVTAI